MLLYARKALILHLRVMIFYFNTYLPTVFFFLEIVFFYLSEMVPTKFCLLSYLTFGHNCLCFQLKSLNEDNNVHGIIVQMPLDSDNPIGKFSSYNCIKTLRFELFSLLIG